MRPMIDFKGHPYWDYLSHSARSCNNVFPNPTESGMVRLHRRNKVCWSSSFDWQGSEYVFCNITDHSFDLNILTVEQVKLSERVYEQYSKYNIPYSYQEREWTKEHFLVTSKDGSLASRGRLTHHELVLFNIGCTDVEMAYYKNKLKLKNDTWANEEATIERPIKVYMCGTDDTSYSAAFVGMEDAKKKIKDYEQTGVLDSLFVYTN